MAQPEKKNVQLLYPIMPRQKFLGVGKSSLELRDTLKLKIGTRETESKSVAKSTSLWRHR